MLVEGETEPQTGVLSMLSVGQSTRMRASIYSLVRIDVG